MTSPATTIRIFACYLLVLGALLLVAPNVVLGLFGIAETTEVWIRVVGLLAGVIGYYYLRAAAAGRVEVMAWTIPPRLCASLIFCVFAALGLGPPVLVLFAAVDASGALWTWMAIRRDTAGQT